MEVNNFNVGVCTTSQLTRYRYVATGGETSVSGSDADGKTLSYTVGLEQVFLNGVNLVRGQDYTATDGTSVGSLTALVASDVVEVFAYVPFNIANALTVSTVDAKGDLLVGTGADAVGRLAVGTDGQLLSAASGETSGLKWANGGLTLIETETFSASAAVNIDDVFSATYTNYKILIDTDASDADVALNMRMRVSSSDNSSNNYRWASGYKDTNTAGAIAGQNGSGLTSSYRVLAISSTGRCFSAIDLFNPFATEETGYVGNYFQIASNGFAQFVAGNMSVTTSYTGFTLIPSAGTMTGSVSVYGYNK